MDYKELNDFELLSMINENSEDANSLLIEKYRYIVSACIKKYYDVAKNLGIDYNDLYQDAYLGFIDGIKAYDEEKAASFPTFLTLCIERRIQASIKKASRIKNKIIIDSLSLEHTYDQFQLPLKDILSDNSENDPLENIIKEEKIDEFNKEVREVLSDLEKEVYSLMISGLKYNEIAIILDKDLKQIDNCMQRIKSKAKKVLESIDF